MGTDVNIKGDALLSLRDYTKSCIKNMNCALNNQDVKYFVESVNLNIRDNALFSPRALHKCTKSCIKELINQAFKNLHKKSLQIGYKCEYLGQYPIMHKKNHALRT